MGGQKPKPFKLPFEQKQTTTNTFAPVSIADTPEAQSFLDTPLDFGSDFDVDPGVGRRTDLAEQEMENRWNSAFMAGMPAHLRELMRESERRKIRSQGAAEAQQAQYAKKQAEADAKTRRTMAELERRRLLLPQILQTGGSGESRGFNTQLSQPQPGFLSSFFGGGGAAGIAGIASKLPKI